MRDDRGVSGLRYEHRFREDLDTADQIAECAVKAYGIDPRRIYATGCSAGD